MRSELDAARSPLDLTGRRLLTPSITPHYGQNYSDTLMFLKHRGRAGETGGTMKGPSRRFGRTFAVSAMAVTAAALMVAGVTSAAVSAQPQAGSAKPGPGYPPPGGIYK